jgi:oligopeptide transport system ATP-binding protein
MEEKKVLLSVKDLIVKFRVRGRILTAIRGVSLDIYENESIAIVGESGSGKSVFTKTFAGMLDENGFIDNGQIIFNDPELADTVVSTGTLANRMIARALHHLNQYSAWELGAKTNQQLIQLEAEHKQRMTISEEEDKKFRDQISDFNFQKTEAFNKKQTLNPSTDKEEIKKLTATIKSLNEQIRFVEAKRNQLIVETKTAFERDITYQKEYSRKKQELLDQYKHEISQPISQDIIDRNVILAYEIYLSVGRYGFFEREKLINKLLKAIEKAMKLGVDLSNEAERNRVFDTVVFRVKYLDKTDKQLHGVCVLNLAHIKYSKDWGKIRGKKIATVFQDPMTSLNPIITIGKQITSIIMKHQGCSEAQARVRALELMQKVGIPNPENRFDDYPFQYSGGMRQRIVIAIALSCQPKILICDEPTTALDVTIQAQILQLLKDLQKEFNYTIVFITHDLGVVANIADRVAVLYAGQIVELGTVEDVFYDPKHPYTWALLSSLPQLAQRNTKLYSITGTPPSLYNQIVGDPFAPRNPYCLKVDTLKEPPMFQVSETHYAKTWLLDPRAPKYEKPELIQDIHEKLIKAFNI